MQRNFRTFGKSSSTDYLSKQYDGKIAGLYDLEETLGRGHFAVVKLARHVFTGEKVAVKVIDKSKLDEVSKAHLFQEVRCMKLVQHPNVVRLYEVIDTATKLYLVLELGDGGDLYEYIMRHETGLPENKAREYFSQIVRAISYCHQLHVVHRDLKPENVVFFKKQGVVKLTDFGFSNKFYPGQKLETSCGSLAYSAPEILLGDSYDAPAVDVWSLGVILYMLVCGQPPFQEANDSETLTMIMDCKYNIPGHVSQNCKKLISRMLLRNPEKRATLQEIASHPWVCSANQDYQDTLPLVSREQLSEDDHTLIVQKIVNGNIATKEEIQESLEKNEYNHITATYYLLAERKLRYKRQEQAKHKRPEELAVSSVTAASQNENVAVKPTLLSVPRTPGDLPQRARKCSIVQEDEEEEDIPNCSGGENLALPLNRRGSRSEGRINLALQERLAESEKRKPSSAAEKKYLAGSRKSSSMSKEGSTDALKVKVRLDMPVIPIPIITTTTETKSECDIVPRLSGGPMKDIFKDSDRLQSCESSTSSPRALVNRSAPYDQKKSKFHKHRTASCSSSDASDDDSEKRKKRAQKLNTPSSKNFEIRRDSHDDSSDSQEPGTGTGSGGGSGGCSNKLSSGVSISNSGGDSQDKEGNRSCNNERKSSSNTTFSRNHKVCRKKSGKTRLRESQSLNRITEVQEDPQTMVVSAAVFNVPPKVKSVGSKILQGLNRHSRKHSDENSLKLNEKLRVSRKDTVVAPYKDGFEKTDNCNKIEKCGIRKIRVLSKYFHMHKKICIPLPSLFNRNGLYRAQSCSSLSKDSILNSNLLHGGGRPRAVSVIRTDVGDINQNEPDHSTTASTAAILDLNTVCNELSEICALHMHLGTAASKCCSFC
nr:unnamed protein product [Callosobruchus analis]